MAAPGTLYCTVPGTLYCTVPGTLYCTVPVPSSIKSKCPATIT